MFLFEYEYRPYSDISYSDENHHDYHDCFNRTSRMTDGGVEQYGYIDIKQPPNTKGRKLKSWKKKWVVLHEMSIRSADRTAAKIDVYTDERTAIESPADKTTFILEYVTAVRTTKSKKHGSAIEVVEKEPMLLLAGETEFDTQTWLTALKKIFWPDIAEKDEFSATILQNDHTKRLMLEGPYTMVISPEVISIQSVNCNSYEWSLRTLKRFNLDKHEDFPTEQVLTIDCGPKSECGEASFQFRAENVAEILESIKRNIFKAVNKKTSETSPGSVVRAIADKPWRTSVTSTLSNESLRLRGDTTNSEQRYRDLLESPTQETKRQRLGSQSSSLSLRSSDDASSLPTKKSLTVTFEDVHETQSSIDEILSATNEQTIDEDEYNRVDFKARRPSATSSNIITTFTVAKPGYQTKVLLDDRGYSHVGISVRGPMVEEDKSRSMSNISSHSSVSCRSDSTTSRDSGCQHQHIDKQRTQNQLHRTSHSFDSAVSTSSIVDSAEILNNKNSITVEVQELEMTAEELKREQTRERNLEIETKCLETSIYQDVVIEPFQSKDVTKDEKRIVKSKSFGDIKGVENHYEELENFRKGKKNLVKHLGMNPEIDPKSIPPALPARPNSQKIKRKFRQSDRKLFTLPFVKSKNKKGKTRQRSSSSSSESDLEEGTSREELSISAWPLGNSSVTMGHSDIYHHHPAAIERYLNDDGDTLTPATRERSSSLNLNTSSLTHSFWKHTRNVSMNVDLLQRIKPDDNSRLDTTFRAGGDSTNAIQTLEGGDTLCDKSSPQDATFDDGDEPIYAEVQPIIKGGGKDVDEPFPDMDSWKPATPQPSHQGLDDTFYENDPLNNSSGADILNQGFVSPQESQSGTNAQADLIDISLDVHTATPENNNSKSAAEIFNLAKTQLFEPHVTSAPSSDASGDLLDLFTLGVIPPFTDTRPRLHNNAPTHTVEKHNESVVIVNVVKDTKHLPDKLNESVYMDMSSCKNESIYVMPSLCKTDRK